PGSSFVDSFIKTIAVTRVSREVTAKEITPPVSE
ncbi:MAG: hypothetical protein CG445_1233, partial [Methanosaeta sp. ASM2]